MKRNGKGERLKSRNCRNSESVLVFIWKWNTFYKYIN